MKSKKQRDLFLALEHFYQRPVTKVSFELFLSIGMILFFAIFAIRPTLVTMSDLLKEIKDKKELNQQLTKKVATLSTVQGVYLEVQDQLYLLDQALPSSPQVVQSIKVIEKIASELSLVVTGLSLNEIPTEKELQTLTVDELKRIDVPVSISAQGDYPTIRQFVEELMAYRRTFVIDTVVFNTEESRGTTKLEARISLSMPYFSGEVPVDEGES